MKKNLPFILCVLVLLFVILFIPLAMFGRGGDGILYSSIAYNMAHNIGSLWQPYYLKPFVTPFYEHPPLAMYFQSLFYRVLGDGFYVENIYGGLMAAITWWFIILCWRLTSRVIYSWWMLWLPLFLWIAIPENALPYKDVILQATLVVFTTASVYFLLRFLLTRSATKWFYLLVGAGLIAAGFPINGVQAFFPLGVFFLAWLVWHQRSFFRMCWHTLLLMGLVALMLYLLCLNPEAKHTLWMYLQTQLFATLSEHRAGPYSGFARLYVFKMVFSNLLVIIVLGLIFIFVRARSQAINFWQLLKTSVCNRWVYFFFGMGLIASLPVLLSTRQDSHYVLQAYPWFVLMFVHMFAAECLAWVKGINTRGLLYRCFTVVFALLLILAIGFLVVHAGKPRRDKMLIHDMRIIARIIPRNSIVDISPELNTHDNIRAYFYRFTQISLVQQGHHTYLLESPSADGHILNFYKKIPLPLEKFALYKRRF